MNEVYVSYNGTLYVPYIEGYVYWDVICSLHERITVFPVRGLNARGLGLTTLVSAARNAW